MLGRVKELPSAPLCRATVVPLISPLAILTEAPCVASATGVLGGAGVDVGAAVGSSAYK